MNLINSIKANLGLRKVIVLGIIFFVIFFGFQSVLNLKKVASLDNVNLQVEIKACESSISNPYCEIVSCEDKVNNDCTLAEEKKWNAMRVYAKKCELDTSNCDALQTKIRNIIYSSSNNDNPNDLRDNLGTGSSIPISNKKLQKSKDLLLSLNSDVLKLNLHDTNYDLKANYNKMNYRLKKTYDRLLKIKISTGLLTSTNALDFLISQSIQKGLNPLLPLVVIAQESTGDANAISGTGCLGLMQFCSGTAKLFDTIFDKSKIYSRCESKGKCAEDDRMDPKKSIKAGITYLFKLSNDLNNNIGLVLSAYNAGTGYRCKNFAKNIEELTNCLISNTNTVNKQIEVTSYVYKITKDYNSMLS